MENPITVTRDDSVKWWLKNPIMMVLQKSYGVMV